MSDYMINFGILHIKGRIEIFLRILSNSIEPRRLLDKRTLISALCFNSLLIQKILTDFLNRRIFMQNDTLISLVAGLYAIFHQNCWSKLSSVLLSTTPTF